MPFAPLIRKQILQALNLQIIPVLESRPFPQLWAGPPFEFAPYEVRVCRKAYLPSKHSTPLDILVRWEEERLAARRMAHLAISYNGASEEKIGTTREMAEQFKREGLPAMPGIMALQLPAPIAFYVPAQVPHGGMALPEREHGPLCMLVLLFTEGELLLRHYDSGKGGSTHYVSIAAPIFKQMELAYVHELQRGEKHRAQYYLLELMRTLRDLLANHTGPVSNSAYPPLEDTTLALLSHVSPRNAELCRQAIDYIQFHLHTPLSVDAIAKVCGVSDAHLNRVFRQTIGVPLMHFVAHRRLQALELMLIEGNERINELARLVGFSSTQSLAVVFKRHKGMSPTEFRRKYGYLSKTRR